MRTFLSHDATAKCSLTGEKRRSEILSSGGWLSCTSFEMSPVVFVVVGAAVVDEAGPKSADMLAVSGGFNRGMKGLEY